MAASGDDKSSCQLRVFDNEDDLSTELAEYIAQLSEMSVKERGTFTIAFSGGSIIRLMGKLCEAPYNKTVDWTKWYFFWADEHAVAKTHIDSNYRLVKDEFLSRVPILNNHVYSINDNATAEDAAMEYEFSIRQLVKVRAIDVSATNDCPKFDLVLLGVGPDGHVASLFPHHQALEHKDWVTYITDSPEPPPERITITLPVINSSSNVALVAVGEDVASVVQHCSVVDPSEDEDCDASIPARMVRPIDGRLVWFLDMAAASKLDMGGDD